MVGQKYSNNKKFLSKCDREFMGHLSDVNFFQTLSHRHLFTTNIARKYNQLYVPSRAKMATSLSKSQGDDCFCTIPLPANEYPIRGHRHPDI